jgi:hypothetical protein
MTGRGRNDSPFRHCEARSAVAIQVPGPQWIASFLAMTARRNDGTGQADPEFKSGTADGRRHPFGR